MPKAGCEIPTADLHVCIGSSNTHLRPCDGDGPVPPRLALQLGRPDSDGCAHELGAPLALPLLQRRDDARWRLHREIDHLVQLLSDAVGHVAEVAAALLRARRGQDEGAVARGELPVVGRWLDRADHATTDVGGGGHVGGEDVAILAWARSCKEKGWITGARTMPSGNLDNFLYCSLLIYLSFEYLGAKAQKYTLSTLDSPTEHWCLATHA